MSPRAEIAARDDPAGAPFGSASTELPRRASAAASDGRRQRATGYFFGPSAGDELAGDDLAGERSSSPFVAVWVCTADGGSFVETDRRSEARLRPWSADVGFDDRAPSRGGAELVVDSLCGSEGPRSSARSVSKPAERRTVPSPGPMDSDELDDGVGFPGFDSSVRPRVVNSSILKVKSD
jgi:hypothetical protein